MELPVLLITNGVLLPEAKLKIPIRSRTNLAMLDRFVVNKTGAGKSLILVAYRIDQEKKVCETGTVALVEQVVCWTFNSHVQYTLHVQGVSRAKIENFAIPVCTVKQLYDIQGAISKELKDSFTEEVRRLAAGLALENVESSFALKKLLKDDNVGAIADYAVSLLRDPSYSTLLDYLAMLDVSKRVALAHEWLQEHNRTRGPNASLKGMVNVENLMNPEGFRRIPPSSSSSRQRSKGGLDELEAKLEKANLPENVKDKVMAEFDRLKAMGQNNSEQHVLIGYLELVAALPWDRATPDEIEIGKAREMLQESHNGMENVKKRVLEFLAVKKLNSKMTGPILCFSGPPGIGKTSIAKAIATALGRKFERISLGGVRDMSDIRGHRRTYVGAMPGRIIQAMKHAGVNNPVILLDEVDKLFSSNQGSPSAALLEVLDPEQNSSFVDHYLNLPFDLSNVIFLATANDLSTIDGPLSDRLEILEMSGYSTSEKLTIAQQHLIPRQLNAHGICPQHLTIQSDALIEMVEGYTMEAGVRQLERMIGGVCRHVALRLAEAINGDCDADCLSDLELPIVVDAQACETILGRKRFSNVDVVERMGKFRPGICFGMAWTPFGGKLMLIETNRVNGTGKITMTGKLGEVLRESVDVARTWIRANCERYEVDPLTNCDLHIHLPSGGVGKDGPSAGCALVASLFSLASNTNIRSDTAVTGEISLTGHVLPVGGIKEKVLGAHRAGLHRVILPDTNRKDVDDIDASVKNVMDIQFVSTIDELLEKIMEKSPKWNVLSKL